MDATVLQALAAISRVHFQHVVNRVGPITETEVDAHMTEAAGIHAREWSRSRHPLDAAVPSQAHDWAARHIAVNLIARERGYDVGWEPSPSFVSPHRVTQHVALTPATRTGED